MNNEALKLTVEGVTAFLKTLLIASIIGALGTELTGTDQTILSILGFGYLTVAVIGAVIRIRKKYLMLQVIKELAEKLKQNEEKKGD